MSWRFEQRKVNSQTPKVLKKKDIPSIAEYIKSKDCKNVFLMLGAGVSTSAGIPDFRSPETGLYSNLARLNLPHPEAVFEINFFRRNPVPFYTLAHELYPGKFRPTITHSFIRLLADKSLLHTCYTQNIDTLERRAGVPDDKIIEAHGSFATQRCIDCKKPYDGEKMKQHINEKKIAKCERCGGYVKPDIVFFGEGLPDDFLESLPNLALADLLIVIGTSLTVQPFASLTGFVEHSCPRVLINLDHVGDFGSRADDVVLLGKCDDIVRDLCKELGWEEDLIKLWDSTEATVISDVLANPTESTTAKDVPENSESAKENPKGKEEENVQESDVLEKIEEQLSKLDLDEQPTPPSETKEDKQPTPSETREDKPTPSVPVSVPTAPDVVDAQATPIKADHTSTEAPKETSMETEEKKQETESLPVDNKL